MFQQYTFLIEVAFDKFHKMHLVRGNNIKLHLFIFIGTKICKTSLNVLKQTSLMGSYGRVWIIVSPFEQEVLI